jgi:hypothetical protein
MQVQFYMYLDNFLIDQGSRNMLSTHPKRKLLFFFVILNLKHSTFFVRTDKKKRLVGGDSILPNIFLLYC